MNLVNLIARARGAESVVGPMVKSVRMATAIGAAVPVGAASVSVGVLLRDKHLGVNLFTSIWPGLLLSMNGVSLNVIGAENLTRQRPAVFIFNHRNNFDGIIVAALLQRDWIGVGKKEIEGDPVAGTLAKALGMVLIDRTDAKTAIASLHQVEDAARHGQSIVISPEGTRVQDAALGSFKKGPFRIAKASGIPLVPIVIRDAGHIASRSSKTLTPGCVDVAVLPPIEVAGWSLEEFPERIEQVRRLYLDALECWPPEANPKSPLYEPARSRRRATRSRS